MTGFYLWAMRSASVILFVIAVVSFVTTLAVSVGLLDFGGQFSPPPNKPFMTLLVALQSALSATVWPLLGAAALWRADKLLGSRNVGPAE